MSATEAKVCLQDIIDNCQDPEEGHENADNILCELLSELGYDDVVNLYMQVDKWYS